MRAHRHFEGLLEFIMSSFAIGRDARLSRMIDAMARAVVRLLLGVSGLLLCSSSCLAGGLPPLYEDFIASTLAPTQDFAILYPLYGNDNTSYSQNYTYSSSGWSNSISSMYENQLYSLTYTGNYISSSNAVTWAGSGSYGTSPISTSGSLTFSQTQDMFALSMSGMIDGEKYQMSSTYMYNYTPSSATYLTYSGGGSASLDGQLAGTFTNFEEMTLSGQVIQSSEIWNTSGNRFSGNYSIVINSPPILPAPEIDPGSMAGALTLLVGGVLTLTGGRRRQSLRLASCGAW
jgi:hypothetical protein